MSSCLVPRRTLLKSSRFDSAENVEGLVSSPEPLGLISKGVSRPRDQKKRSPNYKSIYDFRPPDYNRRLQTVFPFENII